MAGRRTAEVSPLPRALVRAIDGGRLVLAARDLDRSFGGIHAVRGFDLSVRDRTLHALIGPNGAGKTTAFNVLSGLYRPERGTIELEGKSIAGLKPEDITAAGVGRSFQITNLFIGLSVEENIRLAVQARSPMRYAIWRSTAAITDINAETTELIALSRSCGHRARPGGFAFIRWSAPARYGACLGDAPANPSAR